MKFGSYDSGPHFTQTVTESNITRMRFLYCFNCKYDTLLLLLLLLQ